MRRKPEDLIGQKINRLHIQDVVRKQKGKKFVKCFVCLCDCGSVCEPIAEKVMRNLTTSCGCFGIEQRRISVKKWEHTEETRKIYDVWSAMRQRCDNHNHPSFERYGGRGITYDPRWSDFGLFLSDVIEGYEQDLELDRIDNDKGYFPDNVRWITHEENMWNRFSRFKGATSKYTGVCWDKGCEKWAARCGRTYLGVFESEVSAAKAYDEFCLQERGEFANLNSAKFPEDF